MTAVVRALIIDALHPTFLKGRRLAPKPEVIRWRVRRYGQQAHIERRGWPGTAFCGYGVRWVADHEAKQHVCRPCLRLWSEAMDA